MPIASEGHAPERGFRQTLDRIVRACATASRTKTEFVRALREQNVRVGSRYAEGGRTAVVGSRRSIPLLVCSPTQGPSRRCSPLPLSARPMRKSRAPAPMTLDRTWWFVLRRE